ncbi:MAG: transposase [Gemmataceae bacterium]
MPFDLFDPSGDLHVIEGGSLPHWFQPGVTYFVTIRTADSVPRELADEWYWRRNDWLARHGIRPTDPNWSRALARLPSARQSEYHRTFSTEFLAYLDRGYGGCFLRRPDLARIVGSALAHFDAERYDLGDYVVMPNHIHLLVGLRGGLDIVRQCYSWKKYAATKINRRLGRSGRFWQEESFDHLVRSPEQLEYLRRYIAENPAAAGLQPGEYLYYRREDML